jgi:hypothetical protein
MRCVMCSPWILGYMWLFILVINLVVNLQIFCSVKGFNLHFANINISNYAFFIKENDKWHVFTSYNKKNSTTWTNFERLNCALVPVAPFGPWNDFALLQAQPSIDSS